MVTNGQSLLTVFQEIFLAWYTLLVDDLEFTTPCWSATSSLLHLNQL